MTHTELAVTALSQPQDPTHAVVLMPGLGTAVAGTWSETTGHLDPSALVLALDLPGHGRSPAWDTSRTEPTIAGLAQAVEATVRAELQRSAMSGLPVSFAGISLAGGVALQLGLRHSETFTSVAVVCSAATIGQPAAWADRAAAVRASGTAQLEEGSVTRWFAPDFPAADPRRVEALAAALRDADDESYALLCEALGTFDVTDQLGELLMPVVAVAGERDLITPPQQAEALAAAAADAQVHILRGAAHQGPTEKPAEVAAALNEFFSGACALLADRTHKGQVEGAAAGCH